MKTWDGRKLEPQTAKEISDAETIEGKRKRLQEFAYHNPIVHAVLSAARYRGLSGDDTMTWLAYEALIHVEKLESRILTEYAGSSSRFVVIQPELPKE